MGRSEEGLARIITNIICLSSLDFRSMTTTVPVVITQNEKGKLFVKKENQRIVIYNN